MLLHLKFREVKISILNVKNSYLPDMRPMDSYTYWDRRDDPNRPEILNQDVLVKAMNIS